MGLGAIILTGGASSRMGVDKARLDWNGRRALDRLAALARDVGAHQLVTAGAQPFDLPFVVEDPPGGGPVAGIMAAAAALRSTCDRTLVLAVDAPTVQAVDLAPLLASASPGACFERLYLPLVILLDALPFDAGEGWSMRRLVEASAVARLPCPPGAEARLRGANTPDERALLLAELLSVEGAQKSGAD